MHNQVLYGAVITSVILGQCQIIFANDFSYFENKIDYWSVPKISVEESNDFKNKTGKSVVNESTQTFDWQKYMDPNHKEFFKEGDYIPPEPFMTVARDPSDYNVKMWFAYTQKKNDLAARLQQKLEEYAKKSDGILSPKLVPVATKRPVQVSIAPIDVKRFEFRMYFDSSCPHCQRMMKTLTELSKRGYFVEAKQIDDLPYKTEDLPFEVSKASREEVADRHILSVPLLLVGDLKAKVVYKMSGYKSVESLFKEIEGGEKKKVQ